MYVAVFLHEYNLIGNKGTVPHTTVNREKVQSECQEIRALPNFVGRMD